MKAEQLAVIKAAANDEETDSTDWEHAIDAVAEDLDAMRTLITVEAMKAEGWRHTKGSVHDWFYRGKVAVAIVGETFRVETSRDLFDEPMAIQGVENMYDLRELVRLLGGAQ
ncbi:MAG TPA: hypothetical protein PK954_13325 [Anaerolineales bacterium]|mgnify:CR=1 FL=1|nr:hypothetical protein [Anaerolineales bacterium]